MTAFRKVPTVTKFRTSDGEWTVEPCSLSEFSLHEGTLHWGDPQHGWGRYLKATNVYNGWVFYAGSDVRGTTPKEMQLHDQEAFAELAAAGLFDLETLEELVTFEVPAHLAEKVQAYLEEAA